MRTALALIAMVAFGLTVYLGLGSLRSKSLQPAAQPGSTHAVADPGGTIYLAQAGSLYRLKGGGFVRLNPGVAGQWMQPVLSPDHSRLVAVDRAGQYSDLYLLDLDGHVLRKLTDDSGARGAQVHWAFYPRFSSDGQALYYSYDAPKITDDYRVDLAIWSMTLSGGQRLAHRQSTFNDYTGGDSLPTPLAGGALLYAKYAIGADGPYSQIWYQARTLSPGKALTDPKDGCGQPVLSPDGSQLAMICTGGGQTSALEVADFNAASGTLGQPRTLVEGTQAGAPTWAADGRTVAYIAPDKAQGRFQLWTVAVSGGGGTPSPSAPKQVTTDLDLDATSAPAWM
jgi:Tol biopolymer transport system component